MTLHSVKTIQALSRGIAVMRALEELREASLDDLARLTKIPKATLSRILLTLQKESLASQRIADNRWVHGPGIGAQGSRPGTRNLLVQVAVPALDTLCRQIIWPSDLSVRSGSRMVLKETSRPHSTLMFNRLKVGFEIDFLLSAPGRAYLAFCPNEECTEILDQLGKSRVGGADFRMVQIHEVIEQTRQQGYGVRDSRWGGHISRPRDEYDDGLNAIAVPIVIPGKLLGCINITWIRRVLTQQQIVKRHLSDLRQTADEIATAYLGATKGRSRRGPRRPVS